MVKKANIALYLCIKNIIYIFATECQTEKLKFHLNGKIISGIRTVQIWVWLKRSDLVSLNSETGKNFKSILGLFTCAI